MSKPFNKDRDLVFKSERSAINFVYGYCVPRVVVRRGKLYAITTRGTAKRNGWRIVDDNR